MYIHVYTCRMGFGHVAIQIHGGSDLLRRQNAERLDLSRNLYGEEQASLSQLTVAEDTKRQEIVGRLAQKLAGKLYGE